MTSLTALMDRLARVPEIEVPRSPALDAGLLDSVRYLGSDAAQRSVEADPYWPKWDSPWWHYLACLELGEVQRVPARAVSALLAALQAFPIKVFPFTPADLPPGCDVHSHVLCHCQLGSVYSMLHAAGVDVERELPWAASWFVRYQMEDGGLNCDSDAYLVKDECPSSMVGTVSPLEAMLLGSLEGEHGGFVDRAAAFLIERRLMLGSPTQHNAVERQREPAWLELCFPRFYFYDVLRGLAALTLWAERRHQPLPLAAIEPVIEHLLQRFPDGVVQLGRVAGERARTFAFGPSGEKTWHPASSFALLEASSRVGSASPALTRQWSATRRRLLALHDAQRITS
ncbi:MAG TPA: hypothetical protein VMG12_25835 [Polyangiaceae bacterium]|nr:hypothetical protein [Polyangiaceae bacterium]